MSKKDDERADKDRLLDIVQDLCISKDFEAEFEAFAKEHADVFMQALEIDEGKSDEHPLVFHDIYRKYLAKFEGIIEQCILKVGTTVITWMYSAKHFFSLVLERIQRRRLLRSMQRHTRQR